MLINFRFFIYKEQLTSFALGLSTHVGNKYGDKVLNEIFVYNYTSRKTISV